MEYYLTLGHKGALATDFFFLGGGVIFLIHELTIATTWHIRNCRQKSLITDSHMIISDKTRRD